MQKIVGYKSFVNAHCKLDFFQLLFFDVLSKAFPYQFVNRVKKMQLVI